MGPVGRVPPNFEGCGDQDYLVPQLLQVAVFCCTRLIVMNDQTIVFSCSLLLNTGDSVYHSTDLK